MEQMVVGSKKETGEDVDIDISGADFADADADFDDVGYELCASAREVAAGFTPFANVDLSKMRDVVRPDVLRRAWRRWAA